MNWFARKTRQEEERWESECVYAHKKALLLINVPSKGNQRVSSSPSPSCVIIIVAYQFNEFCCWRTKSRTRGEVTKWMIATGQTERWWWWTELELRGNGGRKSLIACNCYWVAFIPFIFSYCNDHEEEEVEDVAEQDAAYIWTVSSPLHSQQHSVQPANCTSLHFPGSRLKTNSSERIIFSAPLSISARLCLPHYLRARGTDYTSIHSHFTYFCNADCNLKTAIAVHNHMPSNWCPWKSPFFVVSVITHSHHFNSSVSLLLGVAGMVPKPSR